MNRILFFLLTACCLTGFLVSCSSDDEVRLEITNLTVGTQNTKVVVAGEALPVQATATADAGIQNIRIQIEPEDGEEGWTYNGLFVLGYSTQSIAAFSESVPVDVTAVPGDYLLILILTDDTGKQVSQEATFTVQPAPEEE